MTANGLGWFIGLLSAFVLSFTVVNIFYEEETNLIVGLCMGAGIGYAQWFVLRKRFNVSSKWVLVCSLCLGIPFVIGTILSEADVQVALLEQDFGVWSKALFGSFLGMIMGGLQATLLRHRLKRGMRWVIASSVGWGLSFLLLSAPMPYATWTFLFGGLFLGIFTGWGILWMRRQD